MIWVFPFLFYENCGCFAGQEGGSMGPIWWMGHRQCPQPTNHSTRARHKQPGACKYVMESSNPQKGPMGFYLRRCGITEQDKGCQVATGYNMTRLEAPPSTIIIPLWPWGFLFRCPSHKEVRSQIQILRGQRAEWWEGWKWTICVKRIR